MEPYQRNKVGMLDCGILTFDPTKNAIQNDAPEGSDTF